MAEDGKKPAVERVYAPQGSSTPGKNAEGNAGGLIEKGAIVSTREKKNVSSLIEGFTVKRKTLGVYLTTMQPHGKVISWLEKEKISEESLFFLDMTGAGKDGKENLFALRDPSDFTELSVVITEIMENEGINFMVLDNVAGLEIYAGMETVKKFLHALIAYFKKLNKTLIIVYGTGENKALEDFSVQVSDIRM